MERMALAMPMCLDYDDNVERDDDDVDEKYDDEDFKLAVTLFMLIMTPMRLLLAMARHLKLCMSIMSQPPFKSPPAHLQGPLPQQPLGQSQELVSKLPPRPRPSAGAAPPSAELPLLAFARPSRPVNMPHGSTDVLHVHPKPSGMLSILVPPPATPLQHSQPSLGGPVVPFCTVRTVSPALGPLPQLQGLALKKCAPTKGKSVICKASSVYVHSSFSE